MVVTLSASLAARDGAILHLPLDDASGTTAVATTGSDGTYVGSPTLQATGPSDVLPFGLATDGTNDRVDISVTLGTTQPQTIEWWADYGADITTTDPGTSAGVMFGPTNSNTAVGFGNFTGGLTNELITISNDAGGSGDRTGFTGSTIPSGWHHHALAFDGSQNGWTWYLDGVANGTRVASSGGAFGLPSVAAISYHPNYASAARYEAWAGIAAFSVYDSELTAAQVYEHYQAGLTALRYVSY